MDAALLAARLFTYAPQGWLLCIGQDLPVRQYQALFAVIGTRFGGDGQTTFKAPNLQGNAALGAGPATAKTSARVLGATVGEPAVTLTLAQLGAHNHAVNVVDSKALNVDPAGAYWAQGFTSAGKLQPIKSYLPRDCSALADENKLN
jgi:microcystin-dependent protein